MKKCKMCNNEIKNYRTYCSNKCKYSDHELNSKRYKKEKNNKNEKLFCKLCNWSTKDILNLGGYPKKHLKEKHKIITDDYLNYYNIKKIKEKEKWTCPICNWSTIDMENKSGWITTHIEKTHNLTQTEFFEKYPDRELKHIKDKRKRIENKNNIIKNCAIKCQICGDEFLTITNSHLKKHNITQEEYKEKYGEIIISEFTKQKLIPLGGTKSYKYTSNGENEIVEFIKSLNFNVIQTYRKIGTEIDIYIPEKNIAIEYNGLYWHSEIYGNKNKHYHLDKTKICDKNEIKLIHIFEDEWKDKKEIIKSKIRNILNKNINDVIYARKCEIKEISSNEKNIFLNKNHLQGSDKSKIFIGAFYNDKLVSVMTFNNTRIALGNKNVNDKIYELTRFAVDINYKITGIFPRLLKYFIKKYDPEKIITYADARFSHQINNIYIKNNFKFISQSKPNYFYMKNYKKRLHRYNFTKHKIINEYDGNKNLTEWENMKLLGYDRIWDCGNYKYELDLK